MDDLEKIDRLTDQLARFNAPRDRDAAMKRAAIMAGAGFGGSLGGQPLYGDNYTGEPFLAQVKAARLGDPDANAYVKGVLGTSDATGQAIIPNAFVADLAQAIATRNPFRGLINVQTGIRSASVEIPYEVTAITKALVQGAYGSNKDIRDFSFGTATATLLTVAQIADVSNQLLRQSGGVAESVVRRRLALSIGLYESDYIVNNATNGILGALMAFGDIAAFKTTLNAEPRLATIGRALGALESRGARATAVVMSPGDYWESAVEGLGTSYAGGWAADPVGGATTPTVTAWGVPIVRCADMPSGTALAADWSQMDMFLGQDFRIDVSSEAGNRFDQNITGFRAEEDFGFNAEGYVRTGLVQKILGL